MGKLIISIKLLDKKNVIDFQEFLILFILIISLLACKGDRASTLTLSTIVFPFDKESICIPFHYDASGHIISKINIDNDTLSFIIDTGANISAISPKYADRFIGKTKVTDMWGITKELNTTRIEEIKWGDMVLRNMVFAVINIPNGYAGIIGGDMLQNYCFVIDNKEEEIVISSTYRYITNNSVIEVPFAKMVGNCFYLHANWLNDESYHVGYKIFNNQFRDSLKVDKINTFLFDTGNVDELVINGETYKGLDHSKLREWDDSYIGFFDRSSNPDDFMIFFLTDLQLDNAIFNNVIVIHSNAPISRNIMGTVFMRRFQSIAIDYPQRKVYFELPEDNNALMMTFSSGKIIHAPLVYWELFYNKINTLGVRLLRKDSVFIVDAILKDERNTSLNRGDTIVGVGNTLFTEEAYNMSLHSNNSEFKLDKTAGTKKIIEIQLNFEDKIELHFLKNDSLNTISFSRDYLYDNIPTISYSYNDLNIAPVYFKINNEKNEQFSYNWHILPWATLVGKEVEISMFSGGKETKTTNKLPPDARIVLSRDSVETKYRKINWPELTKKR